MFLLTLSVINSREEVKEPSFQLQVYGGIFRHSRAVNSVIGCLNWSKLELNLDTCVKCMSM